MIASSDRVVPKRGGAGNTRIRVLAQKHVVLCDMAERESDDSSSATACSSSEGRTLGSSSKKAKIHH